MSNREIFAEIEKQLREGKPVAQATVIQTRGSTPRKEGSRMLIRQDGTLAGTVGGGCGEAGVIQKAKLTLIDGNFREELADLTEEISRDTEAVCGGTLRVFIQPWRAAPGQIALAEKLKDLAGGEEEVILHQLIRKGAPGEIAGQVVVQNGAGELLFTDEAPEIELPQLPGNRMHQITKVGDWEVYSERWEPTPTLIIVGAGHIAEPLEAMGRMSGFRTVVVDDRRMFANRERFPDAGQVVSGPILEVVGEIPLSPATFMVLVTRGHALDMDALRVVIDRRETLAYLGMIGSTRRIRAVFQLLEEEGYQRSLFEHVRAPVGLSVGAETPAEIAVSVIAEMVAVRRHAGDDTRPLVKKNAVHPALRPLKNSAGRKGKAAGEQG